MLTTHPASIISLKISIQWRSVSNFSLLSLSGKGKYAVWLSKCGTPERVFSQALAHGNSKNEIVDTEEEGKNRKQNMERRTAVKKK